MKIELMSKMKSVRGEWENGDVVDIPDHIALSLIKNGQAKPVAEKKQEKAEKAIKNDSEKR